MNRPIKQTRFKILTSFALIFAIGLTLTGCGNEQQANDTTISESKALPEGAILVSNQTEFANAVETVEAGQTIVLSNGVWSDFEILFKGVGTSDKPITLKAETEGKVIISGQSSLRLQGEYLLVSGLVFKNGYSPTGAVIEFRGDSKNLAYHSRVTRTVIDNFSNPDKFNSDNWVSLYGKHNRFDHNHIEGKSNKGVTVAVRLNSEESQENYHKIDHNYFGPRPILGSNGGETLRIGTSRYSLSNSFTTVENNYFDRANGEVEIISNKSGSNVFRNNVFFESRGTLTLRHGNGNLVEGNVFFGNGKDHTGGIRVINADQTIRNNYMEGLTGIRFGGGFTILNGVPNSRINRYHQVKNAVIENNTIVGVDNINLAAGSDAERTAIPIDSTFKNNLVINDSTHPFKIFDDVSGIAFEGNLTNQQAPNVIASGFEVVDLPVTRNANGLLVSEIAINKEVGASSELKPLDKASTGVDWYPKAGPEIQFNSGETVSVSDAQSLYEAVKNAQDGTRILLSPGEYELNKQMQVKKVVSIEGDSTKGSVTLFPLRSIMMEIEDGGSLRFANLTIDGQNSPDSSGNVLVRNTRLPTILNYRLELESVNVVNLNVNHSAHLFDAGYRSMADSIVFKNSVFENITGDILRLNKETDDLGIYNAEYITIDNSVFKNIQGAIAKVYRGGTDESTFGPHFFFTNNTVDNIGLGKRNKAKASIFLHGVQDTDMINNTFKNSASIIIDHTVGEPQTLIQDNNFGDLGLPIVTEVFTKGESTAILVNNN